MAVRLNGLRHGFSSREVVLPGEDETAFEVLHDAMYADLAPSGPVEAFLAERVINSAGSVARRGRRSRCCIEERTR